ncbi:HIT-like protein [Coniophora puteana RWD-64-598 SS2]|uniref:HIT-like protein n=1 Tax=Coniophora puteana (strain RWD-64-598) TaxID=741705 RepID=A0A5M3N0X3_CONPW|nr:HIT-like protein [Coniophora puteana RWD-64-598 SS2]EIW85063.1 HIT-like protein [Coniophora puteana RWD-64-598 SS2]
MSTLTILRRHAQNPDPASLPPSVLLDYTDSYLTIFDAYPKATFHLLVLPRPKDGSLTLSELSGLRSLLSCQKKDAKKILDELAAQAEKTKELVREEMVQRYGYSWDIWVGFHAVPSMEHIHLHVISSDLCSPKLKNKKHYNSFHPKLGFFLHLEEVLSWFEEEPKYFATKKRLKPSEYEPLLKESLVCWRCDRILPNMPTLKNHLQEEWDKEAKRAAEKKRKRESGPGQADSFAGNAKKQHVEGVEEI